MRLEKREIVEFGALTLRYADDGTLRYHPHEQRPERRSAEPTPPVRIRIRNMIAD